MAVILGYSKGISLSLKLGQMGPSEHKDGSRLSESACSSCWDANFLGGAAPGPTLLLISERSQSAKLNSEQNFPGAAPRPRYFSFQNDYRVLYVNVNPAKCPGATVPDPRYFSFQNGHRVLKLKNPSVADSHKILRWKKNWSLTRVSDIIDRKMFIFMTSLTCVNDTIDKKYSFLWHHRRASVTLLTHVSDVLWRYVGRWGEGGWGI